MQQHLNLVKGISKGQLENIATSSGEGAFALDNSGNLLFLNAFAEQLFGWSKQELLNKNFFTRVNFTFDTIASIGVSPCEALKSVGCPHLQKGAAITCKNGRLLKILFISIPVFEQGRVVGKVFIFSEGKQRVDPSGVYEQLVNNCTGVLLKLDREGSVVYANTYCKQHFGDEIDKIVPPIVAITLREHPERLLIPSMPVCSCKDKYGIDLKIAWSINPIRNSKGDIDGAICVGTDISGIARQSIDLMSTTGITEAVIQNLHEPVLCVDLSGRVSYLNPAAERLTGWSEAEASRTMLKDVLIIIDSDSRQFSIAGQSEPLSSDNASNMISGQLRCRDGQVFPVEAVTSLVKDENGKQMGSAIVFRKFPDSINEKPSAIYDDKQDIVTGLMARLGFEINLLQALESACNDGRQHALCFIDIDAFASLNDLHDEQFGDNLLKQIAVLINQKISATDIVARIGDDEFGVLLHNCSLQAAQDIASQICQSVSQFEFTTKKESIKLSVSIGLIPLTSGIGGLADVLQISAAACFVAKEKGRDQVHTYAAFELSSQIRQGEFVWVDRIRQALSSNQFRLYTQVITPLKNADHSVPHYEVLLRLLDDTGDLIRPGAFLPTAVRFGLMPSIDRWVVAQTLSLLEERIRQVEPIGIYAINLSAQSLDDNSFLSFVIDQLDKSCFPVENICFEITESSAISNLMSATRFMSIVRGMGCRFSLDDFGRGFSSYAHLKNLPLDYLKIDGSFIRELANDPINFAMVQSINQLAHILGVQTIAECVENDDVMQKLISIGVDHVQGHSIGKPTLMQNELKSVKQLQLVN